MPSKTQNVCSVSPGSTFAGGPLNDLNSWSGNPTSFTADNQTFIIDDEAFADADWTLAGIGTELIIDTDEEITFQAGTNVTFDGITVEFTDEGRADLILNGNIDIINGVTWEGDRGDFWSIEIEEDGDQTITTDQDSKLMAWNFDAEKSQGTLDLVSTGGASIVFEAFNNLDLDFDSDALFRDNGNTFVVGDDIEMDGDAGAYELTGTLEHRVIDGNSDYEIVVPELHHLYVWVREDGNPRFRDEDDYTQQITINGDFTVDMESIGDFEFNDVILNISGAFDLTHHRPEEGHDDGDGDGEIDIDDAVITTEGDAIFRLSKEIPDGDENIDVDNGVFNVGGNLYIFAENNGEFDFDSSEFTVDGYAEISMIDGGIVDMDESTFTVMGDLTVDINSIEDFEFGEAGVNIGNDFHLSHHRPEGADGDGEVDMDNAEITVGGDMIVTVSKDEADGDENIDADDAGITIEGNMIVNAIDNGEFDFDLSTVMINGNLELNTDGGGIVDLDESVITVSGNLDILSGDDGEIEGGDVIITLAGNFTVDPGFNGSIDTLHKITFNGSEDQDLDSALALEIEVLEVDKSGGTLDIKDESVVRIEEELFLTAANAENNGSLFRESSAYDQTAEVSGLENAVISVDSNAMLIVGEAAEITGADENRFVSGPLTRAAAREGEFELAYPIGIETYLPATLFFDHSSDTEAEYTLEALVSDDPAVPPFDLPDGFSEFVGDVYYSFTNSEDTMLNAANIAFMLPDGVENPEELRILKNGESVGGEITNGVIRSTAGFTAPGFFTLARVSLNETKEITSFVFEDFTPEVVGEIDQELLTITATVPNETDVTALVPTIEFLGTDLDPASGVAQDFSEPVIYTVTAEDGSEAEYTATVIIDEPITYELTLDVNIPGAAVLDGEGAFEAGETVTVSASPNTGFLFEGWFSDDAEVSTDLEYTFEMPDSDLHLVANFETAEREDLAYFWFFGSDLPNNTELEFIDPVFPEETEATLDFISSLEGYPDTDRRGSMERRNRPTELNYRPDGNQDIPFEDSGMRGIQITQPFEGPNGENTMIFNLPSLGFENLLFSFAAKDEGAAEGLFIEYSVSADEPEWTSELLSESDSYKPLMTDQYQLYFVDFSDIAEAANNEDFKVRIRFDVPEGEAEDGDRVTFNNVALEGDEVDAPVIPDAPVLVSPENEATEVEDFVFTWNETDNTDSYTLQIAASDDFEDVFAEVTDMEDSMADLNEQVEFEELTTYFWRVRAVNENGAGDWSAAWSFTTAVFTSVDPDDELPAEISLRQNYPNPFNPTTQINYELPESADVRLEVYNIQGQQVTTLVDAAQNAGWHSVNFDAANLASGVYLYRLTAGSTVISRKMTLVK